MIPHGSTWNSNPRSLPTEPPRPSAIRYIGRTGFIVYAYNSINAYCLQRLGNVYGSLATAASTRRQVDHSTRELLTCTDQYACYRCGHGTYQRPANSGHALTD